jgi:hypothetical protein
MQIERLDENKHDHGSRESKDHDSRPEESGGKNLHGEEKSGG